MQPLSVFCESEAAGARLGKKLAGLFDVQVVNLERIGDLKPQQFTVVDVSLRDPSRLLHLREWLKL